jgi:hypothetical protein
MIRNAAPSTPSGVQPTSYKLPRGSRFRHGSPGRAHPWPLDVDLAAVKSDLAAGAAPPITMPCGGAAMARPHASSASFSIMAPGASIPAAKQKRSKLAETSSNALPTASIAGEVKTAVFVHCLHDVAFLSWNQHPEPTGSRRATPLLIFQRRAGHPPISKFRDEGS